MIQTEEKKEMYSLVCGNVRLHLMSKTSALCPTATKISHTTPRMCQVISQCQTQFAFREIKVAKHSELHRSKTTNF